MRKAKGLIGKKLVKVPPKPPPKKGPTLGPTFGVKTHQRPQDAPHKL